jgi:hypothetical protein
MERDQMAQVLSYQRQGALEYKQMLLSQEADYKAYLERSKAAAAAAQAATPQGIYSAAGIKSPEETAAGIQKITAAQSLLRQEVTNGDITWGLYSARTEQLTGGMNLLTEGNSRARGELRQLAAGAASLAFEFAGAAFGIGMVVAALTSPAMLGGKYLKEIEDVKLGIASVVLAMGTINGQTLTWGQASQVADEQVRKLQNTAMSMAGTTQELAKAFQAVAAQGLEAGMSIDQVRTLAIAGVAAGRALGISTNTLQRDIRDMVLGIRPNSTILSASLGITKADIDAAKASSGGLFEYLDGKLKAFSVASAQYNKTFTGMWEQMSEMFARSFAESTVSIFDSTKKAMTDIMALIGTVDTKTSELHVNPELKAVLDSVMSTLSGVFNVIVAVVKGLWEMHSAIILFAEVKLGLAAWGLFQTAVANSAMALGRWGVLSVETSMAVQVAMGKQVTATIAGEEAKTTAVVEGQLAQTEATAAGSAARKVIVEAETGFTVLAQRERALAAATAGVEVVAATVATTGGFAAAAAGVSAWVVGMVSGVAEAALIAGAIYLVAKAVGEYIPWVKTAVEWTENFVKSLLHLGSSAAASASLSSVNNQIAANTASIARYNAELAKTPAGAVGTTLGLTNGTSAQDTIRTQIAALEQQNSALEKTRANLITTGTATGAFSDQVSGAVGASKEFAAAIKAEGDPLEKSMTAQARRMDTLDSESAAIRKLAILKTNYAAAEGTATASDLEGLKEKIDATESLLSGYKEAAKWQKTIAADQLAVDLAPAEGNAQKIAKIKLDIDKQRLEVAGSLVVAEERLKNVEAKSGTSDAATSAAIARDKQMVADIKAQQDALDVKQTNAIAALPKSPYAKELDALLKSTAGVEADTVAIQKRMVAVSAGMDKDEASAVSYKNSSEMEMSIAHQVGGVKYTEAQKLALLNAAADKDWDEHMKRVATDQAAEVAAAFAKGGAISSVNALYNKYFTDMSAGDKVQEEFSNSADQTKKALEAVLVILQNQAPSEQSAKGIASVEAALTKLGKATTYVSGTLNPLENALEKTNQIAKDSALSLAAVDVKVAEAGGGVLAVFNGQIDKLASLSSSYSAAQGELDAFNASHVAASELVGKAKTDYEALEKNVVNLKKAYLDARNAQDQSFGKGAGEAFGEYLRAADNMAAQAKTLFGDLYKNAEDDLTNFITTGKSSFSNMLTGMETDLARMAAKQIVLYFAGVVSGVTGLGTSTAASAASSASGSSAGSLLSSAASTGYSWLTGGSTGGAFSTAAPAWYTAGIADGTIATGATAVGSTGASVAMGSGQAMTGSMIGSESGTFLGMGPVGWVALAALAAYEVVGKDPGPAQRTGNWVGGFGDPTSSTNNHWFTNSAAMGTDVASSNLQTAEQSMIASLGLTADQIKTINTNISALSGKQYGFGQENGDQAAGTGIAMQQIIHDRMQAVADALGESLNKLVLDLTFNFSKNADQYTKIFGTSINTTDIEGAAVKVNGVTETVVQTFTRLLPIFQSTDAVAALMGKNIATAFGGVGLSSESAREDLIKLMGGLDQMGTTVQNYRTNYFSAEENTAAGLQTLSTQFTALGVTMPTTRDALRQMIEGQDLSTESGRTLAAGLLNLSGSFANLVPAIQAVADTTAQTINSIGQSLSAINGNNSFSTAAAQTLQISTFSAVNAAMPWITSITQLASITADDASHYSAANQQLISTALGAAATLANLQQQTANATSTISAATPVFYSATPAVSDFTTAVVDATTNLYGMDTWLAGITQNSALSPLTAAEQQAAAETQYVLDVARAGLGDVTALGNITKDADAYLTATKNVSGFGSDYSAVFSKVTGQVGQLVNQQSGRPVNSDDIEALRQEIKDEKEVVARLLEKGNADAKAAAIELLTAILDNTNKVVSATVSTSVLGTTN